jgi:hypothetical protein
MAPKRRRHIGHARSAQQIERGIAAGGEIGRSIPRAYLAGILAQGDIAHVMQSVLDLPVPTPEPFEPSGVGLLRRQAGQGIRPLLMALPRSLSTDILDFTVEATDLRESRPARDGAPLLAVAMPVPTDHQPPTRVQTSAKLSATASRVRG